MNVARASENNRSMDTDVAIIGKLFIATLYICGNNDSISSQISMAFPLIGVTEINLSLVRCFIFCGLTVCSN